MRVDASKSRDRRVAGHRASCMESLDDALSDVVAVLEREGIPHALIGAAAMALHGVSRATADVDRFTVAENPLHGELGTEIEQNGATLRILEGDFEDPLAGSVRVSRTGDRTVDVVVGALCLASGHYRVR